MNRRSFFSTLIKGVGVFSILPPAETYSMIWKATRCAELEFRKTTIGIRVMLDECDDWPVKKGPLDLSEFFKKFHAISETRKPFLIQGTDGRGNFAVHMDVSYA